MKGVVWIGRGKNGDFRVRQGRKKNRTGTWDLKPRENA